MTEYPHVPAAFINAIAEEGTKAEAVTYLQKQWNENCALRAQLKGPAAPCPTPAWGAHVSQPPATQRNVIEAAISKVVSSRDDLGHAHFVLIRDAIFAALNEGRG